MHRPSGPIATEVVQANIGSVNLASVRVGGIRYRRYCTLLGARPYVLPTPKTSLAAILKRVLESTEVAMAAGMGQ